MSKNDAIKIMNGSNLTKRQARDKYRNLSEEEEEKKENMEKGDTEICLKKKTKTKRISKKLSRGKKVSI